MKYIRTKDTIFKVVEETDIIYKVVAKNKKNTYSKSKCQTYVLESADTIEELCDVIVCRNKLFYPLTSNREGNEFNWEEINRFRKSICMSEEEYNEIKETTNDFEPYFWKVYGAIWTDKGLIYVAKMNDKGELELL